jgi:hypothetical protein
VGGPAQPQTSSEASPACSTKPNMGCSEAFVAELMETYGIVGSVAEPPELFQLKCLSHAPGVVTHLNRNNPSVPQI